MSELTLNWSVPGSSQAGSVTFQFPEGLEFKSNAHPNSDGTNGIDVEFINGSAFWFQRMTDGRPEIKVRNLEVIADEDASSEYNKIFKLVVPQSQKAAAEVQD